MQESTPLWAKYCCCVSLALLERLRHEVSLLTSAIESRDLDKQSRIARERV